MNFKSLILAASLLPFTSVMAGADVLTSQSAGLTPEAAFGTMGRNPHTKKVASAPAQKVASLANARVNGVMMYDNDKDVTTTGVYAYTLTAPVARKQVAPMPRVNITGDAVMTGGKIYTFVSSIEYGMVNSANYYVYDAASGAKLSQTSMGYDLATVYSHRATSSAIDPVSGVVYCSSFEYDADQKLLYPTLKTWDLTSNTKTTVARMAGSLIVMAADRQGNLYGITASSSTTSVDGGYLMKINKADGTLTKVGDTGVRPYYDQSAVIDATGKTMYWFANDQKENSNVYAVNLATAEATLIGATPNGDEVVAAWLVDQATTDGAPSAAQHLSLAFAGGSLVGMVNFDVPTTTYSGDVLTGDVKYTVKANDAVVASGTAQPGASVSAPATMTADGNYEFVVTLSNAEGNSIEASEKKYVGYDTPLAVTDVVFTNDNGNHTVTWKKPAGTVNGGYMADEDVTYDVICYPEGHVVAGGLPGTVFTTHDGIDLLRSVSYGVVAVNRMHQSAEAKSNSIVVGSFLYPPYSQDFTESDSPALFTIVDANADKNTWYYSVKSMKYRASYSKNADDWLFLPAMNLRGGFSYELGFDFYGTNARYTNTVEVKMGDAPTAEAMTTAVGDTISTTAASSAPTRAKVNVMPKADGVKYIGIHIISAKSQGTATIDNISLAAGVSALAPDTVTDLKATAGAKGALSAQLSFCKPVKASNGQPLSSAISKVEVYRNDALIATLTDAEALSASPIVYNDALEAAGKYEYGVKAYNAEGESDMAKVAVYVGEDAPATPLNVAFTDREDGTGTLTWNLNPVGLNGGYVNEANVVYQVLASDGTVVATDVKATSCEVQLDANAEQKATTYKVKAALAGGKYGTATESNMQLVGKPYAVPYQESFAGAATTTNPWTKTVLVGKNSDVSWSARADQSSDADGGSADMGAYVKGAMARWESPKIDLSNVTNPVLSMYVLMPTGNMKFTAQVQTGYGEWTDLTTVEEAAEWTRVEIPLTGYAAKNVRLGLLGECVKSYNFMYVDNVEIKSQAATGVTDIDAPATSVRYFNLQGVEVKNPESGSFVIKVEQKNGARKATKMFVK